MSSALRPFSNPNRGLRDEMELAALISHQFRTPLYTVRNALSRVMESTQRMPSERRTLLDIMDRNVDRLIMLTERCLLLMELQNHGGDRVCTESLDLRDVIERTIQSLDDGHGSALNKVAVNIPPSVARQALVSGDSFLIEQALANIIANALQYACTSDCRTHPCISVSLLKEEEQQFYRVTVRDSGPGIPRELQDRIFEPFFRLAHLCPLRPSGSGLGLSIVKIIINSLGGEVGVDCGDAGGSSFWFRLPACTDGSPPPIL